MPRARISSIAVLGLLLTACSPNAGSGDSPAPTATDQISMTRGPCFGACPMYTVTVRGDGHVHFAGDRFVEKTGEHTATIDPERAAELFAEAERMGFFALPEDITPGNPSACGQAPTDMPGAEITIIRGDRDRTVRHYHGCPKAPAALTAFEELIDDVAGTERWIGSR